jgi:prevent-host-death family protein
LVQVNIHEAKTHLSRLVDRAAQGEDITIARAGKPIAKLVAYRPDVLEREPGIWRGEVWIGADFDATDADVIRSFEQGT